MEKQNKTIRITNEAIKIGNEESKKIGLSFFEAEDEFIEVSETDIKLNYCITPKQIYKF